MTERCHEFDEVIRRGRHVVAGVWICRVADAAHVGDDAREVRREEGEDFAPVVGGLGDAVLEHERWAGPGSVVVQADAGEEAFAAVVDGGGGVVEDTSAAMRLSKEKGTAQGNSKTCLGKNRMKMDGMNPIDLVGGLDRRDANSS